MDEVGIRRAAASLGVRLVGVAKSNGWLDGFCPFAPWRHGSGRDRNPSFGLKISVGGRSGYQCFTCKSKGTLPNLAFDLARLRGQPDLIALGQSLEEAELLGADATLPDWDESFGEDEGPSNSRPDQGDAFTLYPSVLGRREPCDYLRSRGISPRVAAGLGLRWDGNQRRVLFPVFDACGHFRGFTGRLTYDTTDAKRNPKVRDYLGLQKRDHFLGGHRVCLRGAGAEPNARRRLCIVEGPFDYARIRSFAIPGIIPLGLLGSTLTEPKADQLESWGLPVIWMVDDDQGGETCLFGPIDTRGIHEYEKGALFRMHGRIPQLTVTWPKQPHPDGKPINDADRLLRFQATRMIREAELYIRAV